MEALNKIIDILKGIAPIILGWFIAKRENKIDNLETKIETLEADKKLQEDFKVIDNIAIARDDLYKEDKWK